MRLPLPFVRRKPPPRHALPDEAPLAPTPKRRDGSTIGVILVLVLTSGFVAGTTATFTGTATNAGNEFAAAALAAPSALIAEPVGNNVLLKWTDAIGTDALGAGYRLNWADALIAMPNGGAATACPLTEPPTITWTKVGVSQAGFTGLTDTGASARANFTDGRVYCYQAQTSYPCCPGGVEGTNPWLSQKSVSNTNPSTAVVTGMTLVSFTSGSGSVTGSLAVSDWFEFTFNQPIDMTATATITTSQFVCADNVSDAIYVGVAGTAAACPTTADSPFRGFKLIKTTGGGVGGTSTAFRFAIASVVGAACGTGPPGCYKLTVTLGARTQGTANPTLTGTYSVEPSSNASYVRSATGAVKICNKSTTSTTIVTGVVTYSADPANGKCIFTGHSFVGKI